MFRLVARHLCTRPFCETTVTMSARRPALLSAKVASVQVGEECACQERVRTRTRLPTRPPGGCPQLCAGALGGPESDVND
jgi:hypothetical protein